MIAVPFPLLSSRLRCFYAALLAIVTTARNTCPILTSTFFRTGSNPKQRTPSSYRPGSSWGNRNML
jgi:hypothetical protein